MTKLTTCPSMIWPPADYRGQPLRHCYLNQSFQPSVVWVGHVCTLWASITLDCATGMPRSSSNPCSQE